MPLHTRILLGLGVGAASGIAANLFAPGAPWVKWIADNVAQPAGQIFLRLLLMTVVPLVFVSIALGVANTGDVRKIGRMGGKALGFFVVSTTLAVVIGLTLVNLIRPGAGIDPSLRDELLATYKTQAQGLQAVEGAGSLSIQTLVNIVPRNPIQAAANMDMLAVIFFALVFGAATTLIAGEHRDRLTQLLHAVGEAITKIIDLAMQLAPYGVAALIFVATSRFGFSLLAHLGLYVFVVLLGLTLHGAVALSALVRFLGGLSPLVFWRRARPAFVTAFSTSSSSATLPTNMRVAEQALGIPRQVAGFVLPLGATMNMNGTSLFEGITVLFLAQVFGVELSLGQQVVVVVMSVITAIGAAGVPGGSLPLIMVVLGSVGVPPEGIAIVLGVDRILDMCRTTLNVTGDLAAAVFVGKSEGLWKPEDVPAVVEGA